MKHALRFALVLPILGFSLGFHASVVAAAPIPVAPVLISELRTQGPGGAQDGFVELWNSTSKPLSVAGWSLRFRDEKGAFTSVVMAPGTQIEARGHRLFTGRDYSLSVLSKSDETLPTSIRGGVRLFDVQGKLIDAVGPNGENSDHEGAGLPAWFFAPLPAKTGAKPFVDEAVADQTPQFSAVRLAPDGEPQDTGDNARDFALVSVSGKIGNQVASIGTPGPENSASPRLRPFIATPVDAPATPNATKPVLRPIALQTDSRRTSMRRLRLVRNERRTLRTYGGLTLRYRLTNDSRVPLTQLTLRVQSITANPDAKLAPAGSADLRLLPHQPEVAAPSSTKPTTPKTGETLPPAPLKWRAKLSEVPAQPLGGALNALLNLDFLDGGLAPGASGEISFALGVERPGDYRVVLGNEQMNLVFEGSTEDDLLPKERLAGIDANPQGASRAQNGNGSANPRGGGASQTGGSDSSTQPLVIESFIISGHTEEGEMGPEDPTPISPVSPPTPSTKPF